MELQDLLDTILADPNEEAALGFIVALTHYLGDPHDSPWPEPQALSLNAKEAAKQLLDYIEIDGPQLEDEIRGYLWDCEQTGPKLVAVVEGRFGESGSLVQE